MYTHLQIVPTILVKTFDAFFKTVTKIEGIFPLAQIDVMDGKFVPEKTFCDFQKIASISTSLSYELHLMVARPLDYLQEILPFLRRISVKNIHFHLESEQNPKDVISFIHKQRFSAGLTLNPETPVDAARQYLSEIEILMLMGVHPGKSGQPFLPETIQKVRQARAYSRTLPIEIDGGVNDRNSPLLIESGANILAVNSFLYQGDIQQQRDKLLAYVNNV